MTVSRIEARFARLKAEGRAAFVPYIMAGDPDAATALKILKGLPAAGADLIEVGFPFSDPMAEGPPIQRAALRALAAGTTLDTVLDTIRQFREGDQETPIILMGYLNIVLNRGFATFATDAAAAGVDGLIVVDCPPEEAGPMADALDAAGVALIRLATPTTDDARLKVVTARTSGFVYYVSVAGITGTKAPDVASVAAQVARIKKSTALPVAVGFGVKSPEQAKALGKHADGVVVGSALVQAIKDSLDASGKASPKTKEAVVSLVQSLSGALRDC